MTNIDQWIKKEIEIWDYNKRNTRFVPLYTDFFTSETTDFLITGLVFVDLNLLSQNVAKKDETKSRRYVVIWILRKWLFEREVWYFRDSYE